MKNFALLALILVSLFAVYVTASSKEYGVRGYDDILLYSGVFYKPKKLFRKLSDSMSFPPKGTINNHPITYIKVTDQTPFDGYTEIQKGGLGHKDVKIRMKSEWNKKYSFIIQIYGQRNPVYY